MPERVAAIDMGAIGISNVLDKIFDGSVDIVLEADLGPSDAVAVLTEFFEKPSRHIANKSRQEIASGLQYIIRPGGSELPLSLLDERVPIDARLRCCAAVGILFRDLFARMCLPMLVHNSETADEMNVCCFLWWEYFPTVSSDESGSARLLRDRSISVMEQALTFGSLPCAESSIHGFGHLMDLNVPQGGKLLQDCAGNSALDSRLTDYARRLLSGSRV